MEIKQHLLNSLESLAIEVLENNSSEMETLKAKIIDYMCLYYEDVEIVTDHLYCLFSSTQIDGGTLSHFEVENIQLLIGEEAVYTFTPEMIQEISDDVYDYLVIEEILKTNNEPDPLTVWKAKIEN